LPEQESRNVGRLDLEKLLQLPTASLLD